MRYPAKSRLAEFRGVDNCNQVRILAILTLWFLVKMCFHLFVPLTLAYFVPRVCTGVHMIIGIEIRSLLCNLIMCWRRLPTRRAARIWRWAARIWRCPPSLCWSPRRPRLWWRSSRLSPPVRTPRWLHDGTPPSSNAIRRPTTRLSSSSTIFRGARLHRRSVQVTSTVVGCTFVGRRVVKHRGTGLVVKCFGG